MRKYNIKKAFCCLSLVITAAGCTGDFETINQNPQGATDELLAQDFGNITGPMKVVFNGVWKQDPVWMYQVQQNLQGDIWSGYMATPTGFAGGSNNTQYNLISGWNGFAWEIAYVDVMSNLLKVEHQTKTKGLYPEIYAMSLVLKVQAMHRIADIYGPIVYSQYSSQSSVKTYDSQEAVYTQMFADLDQAVTQLSQSADSGAKSIIASSDFSNYKGDYIKWTRYANSLRLRLAMRIVKKNPTLAKTQAEKAVSQKYGVLQGQGDSFVFLSGFKNPVNEVSSVWGDICMSADMESNLLGYKDPRIGVYFNTSTQFPGTYKGIRTGIEIADKPEGKALRADFSRIGKVVNTTEQVWMSIAEVFFLRAEGALRGWNMGDSAANLYNAGITASFVQHNLAGEAAAYIANNSNLPINYVDPVDAVNNGVAVNKVTVAWDNAASNEVKLQKIMTQKWIAVFPDGQEAWSEWRRTGYPKLFPVVVNKSNGVIGTATGVRRTAFAASELAGNPEGLKSGQALLGGPDNGATRLWWDTTGPNF